METATNPGSDSEYLMTEMGKMEKEWNLNPNPHLRDVGDGWMLVFVTGIMGFASLALQTQKI